MFRRLWIYLADQTHWKYILCVAIGGYASALAIWARSLGTALPLFIFENVWPTQGAPSIFYLVFGAIASVILWLFTGLLITRRSASLDKTLNRLAGIFFLPSLTFPLLVLSIKGIEEEYIWLTYALIGLTALIVGVSLYLSQIHEVLFSQRVGIITTVVFSLIFTIFFSFVMLTRHARFLTHAYDLGIQDQAFWTLLQKGIPLVTLYGETPVNQFGDHFTPIYYLLLPFYAILGDARALLIIQSTVLGAAAIPLFLLARHVIKSQQRNILAMVLVASFLLHPALHGVATFDFHELALAPLLLFWALYFLESGRNRLMLVFLGLALMVKEDVPLSVAAIGLYLFFFDRQRRLVGLVVLGVSTVYFLVVNLWIMPALGGGPDVARFAGLIPVEEKNLWTLIQSLLGNPIYAFSFAFLDIKKLTFLVALLLPVLFLPLRTRNQWIMAVPALSVALLSSTPSQFTLGYHYPAIMLPFIYYLAAWGIKRIHPSSPQKLSIAAALIMASLMMSWQYGWILGKQFDLGTQRTTHTQALQHIVEQVPENASVSAMSDIVPHLSNREDIYLFPEIYQAEFIVFDSSVEANFWPYRSIDARGEAIGTLLPYLESTTYGLVTQQDGVLLLAQGFDPTNNYQAVVTLFSPTYDVTFLRSAEQTELVQDPQALGGFARISYGYEQPKPEDISLLFGPYVHVWPGRYQIVYRLKLLDENLKGRVATVDVFSHTVGGPIVRKNLDARVFEPGDYQDIVLELNVQQLLPDVEFRVLHSGLGTLAAGGVEVRYLGP